MVLSSPATKVQLMTETSRVITGVTESAEMQPGDIGEPDIDKKRICSIVQATIVWMIKLDIFWLEAHALLLLMSDRTGGASQDW